jgi:hypothetical protein
VVVIVLGVDNRDDSGGSYDDDDDPDNSDDDDDDGDGDSNELGIGGMFC